ncbi:YopX family protein [Lactiplantibacillus plantarum]|uniref:YopX family protein n=1 Tax=Lactiplantibacillus plantarum TaxID=1590 RepID=UPI00321B86A9
MIKFRAWIKTGNKTDDYVKPMTIQQMIHSKKSTFSLSQLNDLVDFEQFTGLKDVNGKDIYEGDIVSVFNEDGNYYNDVIEWCIKYNYPAFDLKYHSYLYASNALSEIMNAGVENIKVIGNVHENPELLKG